MHIIQIILDGFKTYQVETVLDGFDRSFNCITGANGSGKSNILDAITFILGIQKWSSMRVSNMKGLICSNGNVKQAMVAIVFDNRDKSQSPPAYRSLDRIEVARVVTSQKAYYMINSKKVPQTKVLEMFLSV